MYRDHNCSELTIKNVGEKVELAGWVQTIRNLGQMEFVDLRDQFGITQITIKSEKERKQMGNVTEETVISVTGKVVERSNKNPKIPTGEIEVEAENIEVLGKCKNVLPFEVNSEKINYENVSEDLRLKYRYLDLRNNKIHNNLLLRSKIIKDIRNEMDKMGFPEIQTPILANSSPEGARDYLVPSRLNPGKFYALPQAPQQFKQLLMCSGFDKYYQIAPCFRDEDPRADRAPGEFYQIDMEMSFATQEDVFKVIETLIPKIFSENSNKKVDNGPFIRIPYKEAMEKYGIDKPDLRNPLIIQDVSTIFETSDFNAFKGKIVKMVRIPNGAEQKRRFFDNLTDFAKTEVLAKGLAWTKIEKIENIENANKEQEVNGLSVTGGIAKFINKQMLENLITNYEVKENDALVFIAEEKLEDAQKEMGQIRIKLGKDLDLLEKDVFRFCWIVDFPMYEYNEDEEKIDFNHNPFSMPQGGLKALEEKDPLDIVAYQYDLVGNGYELASGAVRNHNPEIMVKAFEIAGYTEKDVKERFGALYTAFQYGTPPHAGIAPGLDRIVMLIAGTENIREVIAFPKNKRARDVMMNSPSEVTEKQLKDVHIKLDLEEETKEQDKKD